MYWQALVFTYEEYPTPSHRQPSPHAQERSVSSPAKRNSASGPSPMGEGVGGEVYSTPRCTPPAVVLPAPVLAKHPAGQESRRYRLPAGYRRVPAATRAPPRAPPPSGWVGQRTCSSPVAAAAFLVAHRRPPLAAWRCRSGPAAAAPGPHWSSRPGPPAQRGAV